MHAPETRVLAGYVAVFHAVVIAAVTALIATQHDHWDTASRCVVGAQLLFAVVLAVMPWSRLSRHVLAKTYLLSASSFVFAAFHFDNPYYLIGMFPELVVFADIYWYRRSLLIAHMGPIMIAFVAGSLMIGQVDVAMLVIAAPVLLGSALVVGRVSNVFTRTLLTRRRFQSTVVSLLEALHARDGYTGAHSELTVALASVVADELRLSEKSRNELADVALLHDIGKIGIPNSILQKPGPLDADEWEIMRTHPEIGERILRDTPGFDRVADAIRHEHERYDGDGYPDGIAGDDIPLASRIVLVCDAYHAMISNRPYREAMDRASAIDELNEHAGTQFDPRVVDALVGAINSGSLDRELQDRRVALEESQAAPAILIDLAAQSASKVTSGEVAVVNASGSYDGGLADRSSLGEAAATHDEEPRDPMTDPGIRTFVTIAHWAQCGLMMSAYLALTHLDVFGAAFVGFAIVMCAVTVGLHPRGAPKLWTLVAGLTAYVAIPLVAFAMSEPVMMTFLIGSSATTTTLFWHRPVLRAVSVALVLFEFTALPVLIFGTSMFGFAAVSARAFPGVILLLGYFAPRMREMTFDRQRFATTMNSLLSALQARDGYTGDHSVETVSLAMQVADRLGLNGYERAELNDVALLHDIGKIGIPDEVLNKPAKLSGDEWVIMREHPAIGEQIVARIPGFESVAEAIRHEHERWDGGGYPDGLAGEEIPLASRIVLVCDAFHAMTSDRPYRDSLGTRTALDEMRRHAGTQFDPRVAQALIDVMSDHGHSDFESESTATPARSAVV